MLSNTDVLHIPGLGFDGLVGYSLIVIGKKCNRNDDSNWRLRCKIFFRMLPSGILKHPGIV